MSRSNVLGFALIASTLALSGQAFAGDWVAYYEQDQVKVSKKEVEGSKLVAFKGETVFDGDIHLVLGVLLDPDHRTEWVDRLYTNHIVEEHSDFDYVLYQAFDLPAMFVDRDYVYHGVATRDAATGAVTLAMNSVEHPKAPETVGVRAELVNSRYLLTPMDGGKTRVAVEILTDPKGWMPAWLTNLVQKEWPVETLNGLRGELSKPYAKPHPLPGEEEPKVADATAAPAEATPATAEATPATAEATPATAETTPAGEPAAPTTPPAGASAETKSAE